MKFEINISSGAPRYLISINHLNCLLEASKELVWAVFRALASPKACSAFTPQGDERCSVFVGLYKAGDVMTIFRLLRIAFEALRFALGTLRHLHVSRSSPAGPEGLCWS
jgi:hypothetical protein